MGNPASALLDIPAIKKLSLSAADTADDIFVLANGAQASAYDHLIKEGAIEEVDSPILGMRSFRTTPHGRFLYTGVKEPLVVPPHVFAQQPAYA